MPSETAQNQEPTMEEILASIRRIISEDGSGEENNDADGAADAISMAEADEDVLELTEPAPPEPSSDPLADIMAETAEPIALPQPAPPPPEPVTEPVTEPILESVGLVGEQVALQTASAFERLSENSHQHAGSTSLEQLVADLLRPALKEWLNTNLPAIVEKQVSRELARIRGMNI